MRACPKCKTHHVIEDGYCGVCRECTLPSFAPATGSGPTLRGLWRHSHGLIFCGTLRVAREDFDTSPHPDFRDKVFDEICAAMNKAPNKD